MDLACPFNPTFNDLNDLNNSKLLSLIPTVQTAQKYPLKRVFTESRKQNFAKMLVYLRLWIFTLNFRDF